MFRLSRLRPRRLGLRARITAVVRARRPAPVAAAGRRHLRVHPLGAHQPARERRRSTRPTRTPSRSRDDLPVQPRRTSSRRLRATSAPPRRPSCSAGATVVGPHVAVRPGRAARRRCATKVDRRRRAGHGCSTASTASPCWPSASRCASVGGQLLRVRVARRGPEHAAQRRPRPRRGHRHHHLARAAARQPGRPPRRAPARRRRPGGQGHRRRPPRHPPRADRRPRPRACSPRRSTTWPRRCSSASSATPASPRDVSHELRSPLMTLSASIEVLQARRDEMPERAAAALDLLVADVARFQGLVEDLLEISRFDAGAVRLAPRGRARRRVRPPGRRRQQPARTRP